MDTETPLARLQAVGISEKRAKQLITPSLASTLEALLDLLQKLEIRSGDCGSLLDELVSNTTPTHHLVVGKYIVDKKMTRQNLTAAIKYLKTAGEGLDLAKFEDQCGIGKIVNEANVKAKLGELTQNMDQTKFSDLNAFNRQVMQSAKEDSLLKWCDGKLLNESVKVHCTAVYQPKAAPKPVVVQKKVQAVDESQLNASQYRELRMSQTSAFLAGMNALQSMALADQKAGSPPFSLSEKKPGGPDPNPSYDPASAPAALQLDLFPHKFHRRPTGTDSVDESVEHLVHFKKAFDHLTPGQSAPVSVTITGRISAKREASKHLIFYTISEGGLHVQVLCNYDHYHVIHGKSGEHTYNNWFLIHDTLRRGDVIGVEGIPCRSKTGELSVTPSKVSLLSPCYHMIPGDNTLKDMETRFRYRHIDMLVNHSVVNVFKTRSLLIQKVREYFNQRGFLEVETPTMGVLAGGATARPFITKHNALGVNLFMRVAPELYLKQLIIGGMHKIFEVGKNYRNEGIDTTHNPEFTAIEVYEAYADYEDWITRTEELIYSLVVDVINKDKPTDKELLDFHPAGRPDPADTEARPKYTLNFKRPWARYPLIQTLETRLSAKFSETIKFPEDLSTPETTQFLIALCKRAEAQCDEPHTTPRLIDALVGAYIEEDLVNPSFITDHPQIMSPLAKYHRNFPTLTERFELFMAKKEICNAYTELNDPQRQRACFNAQAKEKNAGDKEAQPADEGYCTALEYGLPPTGGWGMGIDRLCMMLTDSYNIKEVILFPAMKPLEEQIEAQKSVLAALAKGDD